MGQTSNKPTIGPKGGTGTPPKAKPIPQPVAEPEPVEEEIPAEEEIVDEAPPDEEPGQESENMDFSGITDEECEKQVDEAIQALQISFARKAAGPKQMKAGTEGLVDEVLMPLILALFQWWRNRKKSINIEGEEAG